jgi:spermidine/putrescine transport system permease protein
VIICRARLLSIGREYEEAAMDLGASPVKALRHVLLPLLSPAILASAVLVFADVIDDFVLVRYLSADAASEPMSVKIYNSARSSPTPALNALATIMLVSSLVAIVLGFLVYRRLTRGERSRESTVEQLAAQI